MVDEETRYEAVRSRDARFDGEFFFAVETTGIYCRPSCPAVTPKRQNVRFYATAAAAQGSGFRACRRCRPDAVPGSAEWNVRADVVGRAMRLISDGVVDREGVGGLAERLGYSARQVQRQLTAEVGVGPVALARAQRAHTARVLLQTTGLPVTEIAFAAGFASVRQFNDTIRGVYAATPTELRAEGRRRGKAVPRDVTPSAGVPLRLAYRGPYQAGAVFDTLAREAVPGVEEVAGHRGTRVYRRTLRLPYGTGIVAVEEKTAGPRAAARGPAAPAGAVGPATAAGADAPAGRPELPGSAGTAAPADPANSLGPADVARGPAVPAGAAGPATAAGADAPAGRPDVAGVADRAGAANPAGADAPAGRPDLPVPAGPAHPADPVIPANPVDASTPGPAGAARGGWLQARLHLTDLRDLTTAVQRLRRLFDLDADPYAVDERLGADPRLGPLVAARPGLRSPGAADPAEFAVRALVGRKEAERLVQQYGKALDTPSGTLTHVFPEPGVLAEAEGGTLGALASALADGTARLDAGADRDDAAAALLALPGMDPRTVALIRMRALGDPDVALPDEPVPDAWRPWRTYACQHIWYGGELAQGGS
ncbi:AlkA N-terminal domain-containing protein [Streptomyces himalayensis]|uniref:Helix-turn-helix domain-containing protein n=1 Tax=Streptomyces himalayensis subsp. himalayensis TaxID=2756131 RepID=A0A7W0DTJ4_9ACTN|nr:AlkA N-terminal domain-containing protein [Streptomyces himalayensis]MBA2950503.1 helix-turn-helix domain-containing protein [Streptomyces himalayensis subsp. himalayensis]